MAAVLHLLKSGDAGLARATIAAQLAAGDRVTVALLEGAATDLPAGVTAHHVPRDLSYDQLLDLIFEHDQVTAW